MGLSLVPLYQYDIVGKEHHFDIVIRQYSDFTHIDNRYSIRIQYCGIALHIIINNLYTKIVQKEIKLREIMKKHHFIVHVKKAIFQLLNILL